MEMIRSLLSNQELNTYVNTQVLMAILIAMIVYRLIAPVIDFLNPFIIAINLIKWLESTLIKGIKNIWRKKYSVEEAYSHPANLGCTPNGTSAHSVK